MIVLTQRHQIENVAGLWIFRCAHIRIQRWRQRMAYQRRLIKDHKLALVVILDVNSKNDFMLIFKYFVSLQHPSFGDDRILMTSLKTSFGVEPVIKLVNNNAGVKKLTYGIKMAGFAIWDE